MENTFPIYGWWHVDYGTFYNVNVKFVTCNAAWNYYNFVSNQVTVASLATGIVIGLPFFFNSRNRHIGIGYNSYCN